MATPLSTRMMARRAAHTLMGSYDAFSTSTGACIAVHCGGSSPATRAWCMQPASDLPYRDAALWTEPDITLRPKQPPLRVPPLPHEPPALVPRGTHHPARTYLGTPALRSPRRPALRQPFSGRERELAGGRAHETRRACSRCAVRASVPPARWSPADAPKLHLPARLV